MFALGTNDAANVAVGSHVGLAALRDEPFVFLREGTGLRRAVETAARPHGFQPHARFVTNELARVLALVAAGLGVSAVSRAVAETAGADVVPVSMRPALRRQVGLVWRSERRRTPAANAFVDHVIAGAKGPVHIVPAPATAA